MNTPAISEPVKEAITIISDAYTYIEALYSRLREPLKKQRIRHFIASDVRLRQAETAVTGQFNRLKDSKTDNNGINDALEKIEQGMDYWRKLVLHQMRH